MQLTLEFREPPRSALDEAKASRMRPCSKCQLAQDANAMAYSGNDAWLCAACCALDPLPPERWGLEMLITAPGVGSARVTAAELSAAHEARPGEPEGEHYIQRAIRRHQQGTGEQRGRRP